MEDRLLDKIAEPFNLQLPEYSSMEEMIDQILPTVGKFSLRDLTDSSQPMFTTDWVKMSDQPGYTVVSLHNFKSTGEIQIANDGAMDGATFKVLTPKRVIIGQSLHRDAFLYELAFMDNDFLIFKRHGNEANIKQKYLFYCREAIGTRLTWNEALERLVDKYRNNEFPWWIVIVLVLVAVGVVVYLR